MEQRGLGHSLRNSRDSCDDSELLLSLAPAIFLHRL
jgi:hypothetical protein